MAELRTDFAHQPAGPDDELLDMKQISALTGIPQGTLRYYRQLGRTPWLFKPGRQLRAYKSQVVAYMRQREADTAITAQAI